MSGKTSSKDTRAWLSGAVNIFHDRFDPIADSSTGRRDLIPDLVYGRQFIDQDLGGMYCAILIVNSELVSATTFRVLGQEVAELPLVATRNDSQGKGYFPSLFFCIETLLKSLNVKDLVLPAADEAESLWKERFEFEKLGEEQLDQYTKNYQLLIFQGTCFTKVNLSAIVVLAYQPFLFHFPPSQTKLLFGWRANFVQEKDIQLYMPML